jgi:hypothetical protein
MAASEAAALRLTVRTLAGRNVAVTLPRDATPLQLKQLLENDAAIGVAPRQQRLIFGGAELTDSLPLAQHARPVTDGAVVHVVLRLVPGDAASPPPPLAAPLAVVLPPSFYAPPLSAAQAARLAAAPPAPALAPTSTAARLQRTGAFHRGLGLLGLIFGALLLLVGLFGLDWPSALLGLLAAALGAAQLHAGRTLSTGSALAYYRAVRLGMLATFALLMAAYGTRALASDNPPSDDERGDEPAGEGARVNWAYAVFFSLVYPLLACGVCALVARTHVLACRERDLEMRAATGAAAAAAAAAAALPPPPPLAAAEEGRGAAPAPSAPPPPPPPEGPAP